MKDENIVKLILVLEGRGKRSIFGKKKVAVCNDAAKLKVGHDDFRVALYHLDRTLRAHVHVGLPPHTVHNGRKSFKHIV